MRLSALIVACVLATVSAFPIAAQRGDATEAAAMFGARPDIEDMSLSPDGSQVAFLKPTEGQGSALYVVGVEEGAKPRFVFGAAGKPDRLVGCHWVSKDRIVCTIYGVVSGVTGLILPFSRVIAINTDGSNGQLLSTRQTSYSNGAQLNGGRVIDWLPDEDGAVLMARNYVGETQLGRRGGSDKKGFGVDHIDTRTLGVRQVELPDPDTDEYISDGRGTVRIRGTNSGDFDGFVTGSKHYSYRLTGARAWLPLSEYVYATREGFDPVAVDAEKNLAYGRLKVNGRQALAMMALDGSKRADVLADQPDVDVRDFIRIGRRARIVGASYVTDRRRSIYFDPQIKRLADALSKALPQQPLVNILDADADERRMLIFAGSDVDPGVYHLLDRQTHAMRPLVEARAGIHAASLGKVQAIRYPAKDGTMVPGYLTLPPGRESAKGLPAIVLPHGGPSARDEWGFDWLSQFYVARGFAVLQPNFRGSAGYGDAWFQGNGFQSWRIAVGDVTDAGRWLIAQGIANPAKLAIVGWSYGGYAALQSAVLAPDLFKAVIAIAPVTDLVTLREEARSFSNYNLVRDFIGQGPHLREGSPAQNAGSINVPVLLFHGTLDRNVAIAQSKLMTQRLKSAGKTVELVTWEGLDHYCNDARARTDMLLKSDAFLQAALTL